MELEKYGVKALSLEEKKEINGGIIPLGVYLLVCGFAFLIGLAVGLDNKPE